MPATQLTCLLCQQPQDREVRETGHLLLLLLHQVLLLLLLLLLHQVLCGERTCPQS